MKNLRTTFCRVPHGKLTAKKWLDSIEKQKRSNLKERDRDRQTDRQSQLLTIMTPRLGAEIKRHTNRHN